jgi:hypothetical protein
MEQPEGRREHVVDKATIDDSQLGNLIISSDASVRIQADAADEALWQLYQEIQGNCALVLNPLRLILITANLGEVVSRWQGELGLPESGLSSQPEGIAMGKTMSWGDDQESARSIIILSDGIAAGIIANISAAISTLAHELGHVHDTFVRGIVLGFAKTIKPSNLNDLPKICADIAEITWSEFAAERVATAYMSNEDIESFAFNDQIHLAGVDGRIRKYIQGYKNRQCDIGSLWGRSVTDLSDVFANLGRAIARLSTIENDQEMSARLDGLYSGTVCWKPVIERLFQSIHTLDSKKYTEWEPKPFSSIEEVIALGFETVGLFPIFDGINLRVNVL